MQRIIAIAADLQHLRNFCKDKNMNIHRFLHITSLEKLRGIGNGYRYIVVTEPYDRDFWHKVQIEFRFRESVRLPLNINEWAITEFS